MNGIPMNPPRTIRRITPQITSLESGTGIGQNSNVGWNRSDRILPRNIGIFGVFGFFDRGESDLFNRSASWHCASKIESESLGGNRIFENSERDNNFEVEKSSAQEFCNFESSQFESHQHQLKSLESCQLESRLLK